MEFNVFTAFAGSGGTVDTILMVFLWLFALGVLLMIYMALKKYMSYNITVEIKGSNNSKAIVRIDKARIYTKKSNQTVLELLRTKKNRKHIELEVPNDNYFDVMSRGNRYLRLKMIDSDNYLPWHPSIKELGEEEEKRFIMPSDQRNLLVSEFENADRLNPRRGLLAMLERAFPIITVILCIFGLVIFMDTATDSFGTITSGASEALKSVEKIENQRIQYEQRRMALDEKLIDFIEDKQIITGGLGEPTNETG